MQTQFSVTGMTCAACSARVEKAVRGTAGVESCTVSLLTNSMRVEGDAPPEAVIAAVTAAGYGASVKGAAQAQQPDPLADTESPRLLKRLLVSCAFLLVLMYVSMGHGMLGWPLPPFFTGNPLACGLLQLLLAAAVMVINQRFFVSGCKAVLHRAPNMDTLVSLGSAASFLYSVCMLFAMTKSTEPHALLHSLYFESAAMIPTLITVGKMLEARAKGKTADALRSLMNLKPKTAILLENGEEREVPAESLQPGMLFIVKPGMQFPADGKVRDGIGAADESMLTGESIPADKAAGDAVSAGTLNVSGFLTCEVTKTGEDTTLSQIIKMVGDAAATKAPITKLADKAAGIFVPAVIGIALVTAAVWLLLGGGAETALTHAVAVLVVSCPCALGLAAPVAVMVGSGVGARSGILFKTAAALEEAGRVTVIALDKTGTVTAGKPAVTDVLPAEGVTEQALLQAAASVEQHSEHPLAKAVTAYTAARGISPEAVTEFTETAGSGVSAKLGGALVTGGRLQPGSMTEQAEMLAEAGKTILCFMKDGAPLGLIAAADGVKPDSAEAVAELKRMGLQTVLLTGDSARTAAAAAKTAGIDRTVSDLRPDGKARAVQELSETGKVCMVGDGINDAPALTNAAVGMAIGAGTDTAVEAADIVLMNSRLSDVVTAVKLSRKTLKNIRENLCWAFGYNIIGIPLAAGAFTKFGLSLSPMFGAAAMSLSSFCVVSNALRLNLFKPWHAESEQTEIHENTKGTETMKTVLNIKGMMCPHCEAHVKKALEAIDGVTVSRMSHAEGIAELETAAPVSEEAFRRAVTDAGYEFVGMTEK